MDLYDIIKKNYNFKPLTINSVVNSYNVFIKRSNLITNPNNITFKNIKDYIESIENINVRRTKLYGIMIVLNVLIKNKIKLLKQISNYYNEIRYETMNKLDVNEKQKKIYNSGTINFKTIEKQYEKYLPYFNELNKKNVDKWGKKAYKFIILLFYLKLPILRPSEYVSLSWFKKDPNYIDLHKKIIVLTKTKTSDKIKNRIITIPNEVVEILLKWRTLNKGGVFFENEKMISPNTFTKKIIYLFGINNNYFRRLYIQENINKVNRTEMACNMGHSVKTQELVYNNLTTKQDYINLIKQLTEELKQFKLKG